MKNAHQSTNADNCTVELSARARRVLADGGVQRRPSTWASSEDLCAELRRRGYPWSVAIAHFECEFGGMTFHAGKYSFELGIEPRLLDECLLDDCDLVALWDAEAKPQRAFELGLVPCGSGWSSLYQLFIDVNGTIYAGDGELRGRSSSAIKLIEQISMLVIAETEHRYRILTRPQVGNKLAGLLGLQTVDDAVDDCEQWWANDEYTVLDAHSIGDARNDTTYVFASTLEQVAAILQRTQEVQPDVGFAVLDREATHQKTKRGDPEPANVPDVESWCEIPKTRRFRFDNGTRSTGTIWLIEMPDGYVIEQFRNYNNRVRGWSSFSEGGSIERSW